MAIEKESAKKAQKHIVYKKKDGTIVAGVTTILGELAKPALLVWANNIGLQGIIMSKYVDALANIGKLGHYLILCHLKNESPELSDYSKNEIDKAENCFLKYLEWEKGKVIEPILLETPVVTEQLSYGGTPDFYGKIDGVLTVMDFKTSNEIFDDMLYQVAAYTHLLEHQGYKVEQVKILQIGRDEVEGFGEKTLQDWFLYFDIFKLALEIYNLKKLIKNGKTANQKLEEVGL